MTSGPNILREEETCYHDFMHLNHVPASVPIFPGSQIAYLVSKGMCPQIILLLFSVLQLYNIILQIWQLELFRVLDTDIS